MKPEFIDIEMPKQGGKIWLLNRKGIFVLERGPATLRTIACTHAGSGSIEVVDGVPDEHGWFPNQDMLETHEDYHKSNGRPIYRGTPIVMGSWMLDGGVNHGLTIISRGGTDGVSAVASIVWVPFKERIIKAKTDVAAG